MSNNEITKSDEDILKEMLERNDVNFFYDGECITINDPDLGRCYSFFEFDKKRNLKRVSTWRL